MTIDEFDKKVIFSSGSVSYSHYPFSLKEKRLKGLNFKVYFQDIEYVDFEGVNRATEFDLDFFIEVKQSFMSIISKNYIYEKLIGSRMSVEVNSETIINDNSVYLNSAHTPVDVLFIDFIAFEEGKLKIGRAHV